MTASVLAGAALAVLILTRNQGATRTLTDAAPFNERGAFDYSAILGRDVYDGDNLRPPQPLFRRLGERLPLRYSYSVSAMSPAFPVLEPHGTYTLNAELTQSNLWSRVIQLAPPTAFEGPSFDVDSVLDVATLGALTKKLEAETGFKSSNFRVRLLAHVDFEARMAGVPLVRSHDQVIEFVMSDIEMRLDAKPSSVEHHGSGTVTFTSVVPAMLTLPLIRTQIPFSSIVPLATVAMGLAGLLAAVAAGCTLLDGQRAPAPLLPARLERRVTDVGGVDGGGRPGARVDVSDLESLFHLAEQYQLPVLRTRHGERAAYWLLAETTYVFEGESAGLTDRGTSGPAPPGREWGSLRPVLPRRDASAPTTVPSSPQRREGRSASPRHSWTAMAAYTEGDAASPGSLEFGVARGRPFIEGDSAQSDSMAADHNEGPRAGRSYWGDVWPQYDENGTEDAA